ncbi:Lsr2 family protein [Mycobacteroides sp. LB1]|nr:Lsr2 family protein [Mycobacteroides sp. LB1]
MEGAARNAAKLRDQLATWIQHARTVSIRSRSATGRDRAVIDRRTRHGNP